ncbi:hypothetical protein QTP88_012808 [Uroleucon formosanum]
MSTVNKIHLIKDSDHLKEAIKKIDALNAFIDAISKQSAPSKDFIKINNDLPNKKIITQKNFFSTKLNRKKPENDLLKPSEHENLSTQLRLKNGAVPQKLQLIFENTLNQFIISHINLYIILQVPTIFDLNYTPLNKKQKLFINIKNINYHMLTLKMITVRPRITIPNKFNIYIDDECSKAGNSNSVSFNYQKVK